MRCARREALGLSLAEAEDHARIRQKFIAAMETEDWDALPGDVPTRGFLRKYAVFLGLSPEEVVGMYARQPHTSGPQTDEDQTPAERPLDYRPIELALAEAPPRRIPWRWITLLLLLILLVSVGWWIYAFRPSWINNLTALPQNLPQPGDVLGPEPTATATLVVESNRVTATPTDTVEPAAETTPTPAVAGSSTEPAAAVADATVEPLETAPPVVTDVMRLHLNLLARSWIRLVIDGQVASETVMEQGSEGDWEARESIVLRTGNAAGVKLTLNDEDLPFLGGPGEVIERRWDLVDGEIIETTPTEAPSPSPAPTDTPAPAPTETPAS
ncbi:MAG: DUF4115 domain-containing protein [Caldilineales bacterium]